MKPRSPWLPLLLVGALTGCPFPQTTGAPPDDPAPTPTPTPSSTPEQPLAAMEITVRELEIDASGILRTEFDASEALVVLPLLDPQTYFVRLDPAPLEALPAYRTAARRFASTPAFQLPAPRSMKAVRSLETTGGYGPEASFTVAGETITAQRAFEGEHCLIYVDARDAAASASSIQALATAFETSLYPKASQLLGTEPGGRVEDGFNRGDDRIVLLISQASPAQTTSFDPFDLFPPEEGPANYGKILHLKAGIPTERLLPSLANELGVLIFLTQRLEAYSSSPVGTDPGYLIDEEAQGDYWLSALMGQLTALACGFTPEAGDRDALMAVGTYLELPAMYRLDTPYLQSTYENNRGQLLLFSAYLQGLKPGFARTLAQQEALGTEALEAATEQEFAALFRDFSLATVLDGREGVPARYSIPHVNLHHTYTVEGKRFPFSGAAPSVAGVLRGEASHQTILLKGIASQGKLRLGMNVGIERKASLVLFRPSTTARFIEE